MYQARLRGEEAVVLGHPSPQVNEGITVTYRRDVHHQLEMTERGIGFAQILAGKFQPTIGPIVSCTHARKSALATE